jgi:amino-acid N-acetyltransferase
MATAANTFRAARQEDLAAIERLLAIAGLESTGVDELLKRSAGDVIVVDDASRPGELASIGALEVRGRDALLRSVAVHPAWRERRLGQALVRHLMDEARGRGIRALYLLTTTAEHFFPKLGFERLDRDAVPDEIAATHEFRSMCPASAVAMVGVLSDA